MIEGLPLYISLVFGLVTIATLYMFYWTVKNANSETTRKTTGTITMCLTGWLILQAILTLGNVYKADPMSLPPKILLFGTFPIILTIIISFATKKGRAFIDSLPLKNITYLNVIRIPVELVLYWLFLNRAIPELMTFAGRNFDILSGITAPFVAYWGLTRGKLNRRSILVWNFLCLGLLMNIVVNAILSTPSPFQKFAFDQPNIAILNFPFSWLPTFVVPVVLFGHLVSIRQLWNNRS